jgi:hypothetical protein
MVHILTSNQLFSLADFILSIVLVLLPAHNLVHLMTLTFLNMQYSHRTFVIFLCAIAKQYQPLPGYFRL